MAEAEAAQTTAEMAVWDSVGVVAERRREGEVAVRERMRVLNDPDDLLSDYCASSCEAVKLGNSMEADSDSDAGGCCSETDNTLAAAVVSWHPISPRPRIPAAAVT